jgi:hypothetical protein
MLLFRIIFGYWNSRTFRRFFEIKNPINKDLSGLKNLKYNLHINSDTQRNIVLITIWVVKNSI